MIGFLDTIILTATKLRTRRLRTTITIVTSGLLFALLVTALLFSQGVMNSIDRFGRLGFGHRYLVSATPTPPSVAIFADRQTTQIIEAAAMQIYTQTIAAKKKAAAKLGISYDPTSEVNPAQSIAQPNGQTLNTLNAGAPSVIQAEQVYFNMHPAAGLSDLETVAARFHPLYFYTTTPIQPDGYFATMPGGAENFTAETSAETIDESAQNDVLQNGGLEFVPPGLADPFLLPDAMKLVQGSSAIPLVVSYATAERELGLKPLLGDASPTQKLARVRQAYDKAGTIHFYGCYRNEMSESQIQEAISDASQIVANSGNKSYQKPDLIHGLPSTTSCGQVPVTSDTRIASEKTANAKQTQFDEMFGANDTPDQQRLAFQIVGIIPDQQGNAPSDSAAGILNGLVGSSLAANAAIPEDLYNRLPTATSARYTAILTGGLALAPGIMTPTYYAEFRNATDARSFINEASCSQQMISCSGAKPFVLSAFGSNSIALRDLQQKFARLIRLAGLVVIMLAVVIMTSTVGRMLSDNRRETAIFRAIGAKRLDIAAIYSLYTFILAVTVAVFALAAGIIAAVIINRQYSSAVTVQAQLAYGGANTLLRFQLLGMTAKVSYIAALSIATGLLSLVLPLMRNMRRNPIRDMRDE